MSNEATKFDFSVVIPAFNESERILPTLEATLSYFKSLNRNFEIIVVNDGSTDNTSEVVENLARLNPEISLIEFASNTGKGAAVRAGMLKASGKYLLFQDADGATPVSEAAKLISQTENADIVIGSRALISAETKVVTSIHRKMLGRIFNFVANKYAVPAISDTQCGFKLFKQNAAKDIFSRQVLNGFSFDVEVLYLANKLGYTVKEVAINWNNIPGTKVNVFLDGLKMFYEIVLIKFLHRN